MISIIIRSEKTKQAYAYIGPDKWCHAYMGVNDQKWKKYPDAGTAEDESKNINFPTEGRLEFWKVE